MNILIEFWKNIWTKKTICLSTADDVIKLKEYKTKKRDEKRKKYFDKNCYVKCYLNQKRYKGWCLHDFYEFGDVNQRNFQVKNKLGEVRYCDFPQGIVIRRYGYDPDDRNYNQPISYIPNFIEQFLLDLKFKKEEKLIEKMYPQLVSILEEKKSNKTTIEINELSKNFEKMTYGVRERMFHKLQKERNDLAKLITIKQLESDIHLPMFKD